jgi:hypothetical protein
VKGNREEVGEELTINIAPRSSVLQIYDVVEFTSLNGVRGATALGTADVGVGS